VIAPPRHDDDIGPAVARLSDLLAREGFAAAFFTRRGGVSPPPWDSLSFAASVGDEPERVRENIARAARALGVLPSRLYFLSQVHGVAARVLDGSEDPADVVRSVGDITAAREPGVAAGVRTADCVPVLLADARSGAVAAVHSGWRGTVQRAAVEGLGVLRSIAGPEPAIVAAIGPHIERCCFEVGADVAAELAACSSLGERAVHAGRASDKRQVDLRAIVRAQLEEAGLTPAAIDDVAGCTACDRENFHSFRRDGARSGRLLSAIVSRPPR
jgi:YfiH family protein